MAKSDNTRGNGPAGGYTGGMRSSHADGKFRSKSLSECSQSIDGSFVFIVNGTTYVALVCLHGVDSSKRSCTIRYQRFSCYNNNNNILKVVHVLEAVV